MQRDRLNRFLNNTLNLIRRELNKHDFPLHNIDPTEVFAGMTCLCSIISNNIITKDTEFQVPYIAKRKARETIKFLLEYINDKVIRKLLNDNILPSETRYNPLETISRYDGNNSIRVVSLSEDVSDYIWSLLTPQQKRNNRMKSYFKYKYDNPPLSTVLSFIEDTTSITCIKGHGMLPVVKIPHQMDVNLCYLLGALRDGGIHYDKRNNAYKLHFEEQNKDYLAQEIQTRLKQAFDLDTDITLRPDGVHQIQFASKPLYLLFSKCFGMREIQQFWYTPILITQASLNCKKEYIRGFFDAEGTTEHLYHSWYSKDDCPPLRFISNVLNNDFGIRCTEPMLIKTNTQFNRFPAFQVFINNYDQFRREIIGTSMRWH